SYTDENLYMQAIKTANAPAAGMQVCEKRRHLVISGENFVYKFSRLSGAFDSMVVDGQELMTGPMGFSIWRAPTDNDAVIKNKWFKAMYHVAKSRTYAVSYKMDGADSELDGVNIDAISENSNAISEIVKITAKMGMVAESVQRIMDLDVVWTIRKDGLVRLNVHAVKNPEFPALPRFGIRMMLSPKFDCVTYCGMGPFESYVDKHRASYHGIFCEKIEDLHEDYLMPQENGSHYDCDFVEVMGGEQKLSICCDEPFSFNASYYSEQELTKKKHAFELEKSEGVILHIDYKLNGIGSNSCGPELLPAYRFDECEFDFEVVIRG
ncbi:MAG: beta-galactosidase small subunit, partial [Lachnospiraceae bacterium]|nr:beta-galactosidase small subunit [Lachnospiraceae bacterium]